MARSDDLHGFRFVVYFLYFGPSASLFTPLIDLQNETGTALLRIMWMEGGAVG